MRKPNGSHPIARPLRSPGGSWRNVAFTLGCLALLACRDDDPVRSSPRPLGAALANCAVAYEIVSLDEDSEEQEMGIPPQLDSLSVCQTWTGSDYEVRIAQVGSYDALLAPGADVPTAVQHAAGTLTFDPAPGVEAPSTVQSGTVLSFLKADAALVAAVQSDPYFNVLAPGECDGGDATSGLCAPADSSTPPEPPCEPVLVGGHYILCDGEPMGQQLDLTGAAPAGSAVRAALVQGLGRQRGRHGIRRPGVRELVEDAIEVERRGRRHRRFRRVEGDNTITLTVDEPTGLLIEQAENAPGRSVRTVNRWRKVIGGYALAETEYVAEDRDANGRNISSRGRSELRNIRVR